MRVPPLSKQQLDFKWSPSSHHQVLFAEPLCLMGSVVVMSLKVHKLQLAVARVSACKSSTCKWRTDLKTR